MSQFTKPQILWLWSWYQESNIADKTFANLVDFQMKGEVNSQLIFQLKHKKTWNKKQENQGRLKSGKTDTAIVGLLLI